MKTLLSILLIIPAFCWAQLPPSFWKETSQHPVSSADFNTSITYVNGSHALLTGTGKSGIYRSSDRGQTWNHVLVLQDTAITKVISFQNQSVLAVAANAVFRSANGGLTWQRSEVPSVYPITDIEKVGNRLIVSTAAIQEVSPGVHDFKGDGVFVSDDGGVTWIKKSLGITFRKAITHLAVNSYDVVFAAMASFDGLGGGLYYSTDACESWVRVQNLSYPVSSGSINVQAVYEIFSLEVDPHDTLRFSFEGSGGNFGIAGNLKNSINDVMWNLHWWQDRVHPLGFEWDNKPFYSYFTASNGHHRYLSLHTPQSTSIGGPYFQSAPYQNWARIPSGMLPVGTGYVKTHFAEDENGRVYATQEGDFRMFYTDTSAHNTVGVPSLQDSDQVIIYPNPVHRNETLYIKTEAQVYHTEFINSQGQRLTLVTPQATEINLTAVTAGLYILSVRTSDGHIFKKIRVN